MIVLRYDPARNPGIRPDGSGAPDAIPGVPLRDLTADDLAALGPRLARSAAAASFYVADPLAEAPAPATPDEEAA